MKRIDTPNRELDLFGAGKDGFRNGNLALGVLPTEFNADWPNGIQEELLAVIEAAGLTPDGGALNQLLLALRAAGVFTTKAVNTNTTEVATTEFVRAELLALGSSPYNAIFGRVHGASGWARFPGGTIFQWGTATGPINSSAVVTLPLAFPTTFRHVLISVRDTVQNVGSNPLGGAIPSTLSQFTIRNFYTASTLAYSYWAIGE